MRFPVVENLTSWNTADLERYVAAANKPELPPAVIKFVHWRGSELQVHGSYDPDTSTATVKIPRPGRFRQDVIDALAATLDGGAKQLPKVYRDHLAHVIDNVLNKHSWSRSPGWSSHRTRPAATWASEMPLRACKKLRRNAPELIQRELAALEAQIAHVRARYEAEVAVLKEQVTAKRTALEKIGHAK